MIIFQTGEQDYMCHLVYYVNYMRYNVYIFNSFLLICNCLIMVLHCFLKFVLGRKVRLDKLPMSFPTSVILVLHVIFLNLLGINKGIFSCVST